MNYPTVLFDADDTLLDFDRSETCALTDTLRELRIETLPGILKRYKDTNLRWWKAFERGETTKPALVVARWAEFLASCGRTDRAEEVNTFYMERLGSYSFTLPGAAEVCAELKERGHTLALVTNGTTEVQRRRWGASPAARYFDRVFVSEQLGCQKPDVRFFDLVLASLGEPPRKRCVIVGDSETSDMRGGQNAGIATCWYNRDGRAAGGKWDLEVRTLWELPDLL